MAPYAQAPGGELPGDPDAAIRQLYSHYAKALHGYVERFCPDQASADDIVQETFIRAWRHLPQLSAHQSVLVETFYRGGTMATVARELGIPHGTARSRLH